jgi:predicted ABC-type ATPase
LGKFDIEVTKNDILDFAVNSGLLERDFTIEQLAKNIRVIKGVLAVKSELYVEHIAQIIARYLRKALFNARKRFSFETVFSHPSTLEIMEQAVAAGYKVYLYFVATESPEINKYRVKFRVSQNGHDVPADKIEQRYYWSLNLMKQAAQYAHQAFFFDNSTDGAPFTLVAHFKRIGDGKKWDRIPVKNISQWFKQYYGAKD